MSYRIDHTAVCREFRHGPKPGCQEAEAFSILELKKGGQLANLQIWAPPFAHSGATESQLYYQGGGH